VLTGKGPNRVSTGRHVVGERAPVVVPVLLGLLLGSDLCFVLLLALLVDLILLSLVLLLGERLVMVVDDLAVVVGLVCHRAE
jgi:hypothetical protein